MNNVTVTVSSVTYAIKARRLLWRAKIQSKLVKLDPNQNENGCSYGVVFPAADLYSAVMELKNNEIPYHLLNEEK